MVSQETTHIVSLPVSKSNQFTYPWSCKLFKVVHFFQTSMFFLIVPSPLKRRYLTSWTPAWVDVWQACYTQAELQSRLYKYWLKHLYPHRRQCLSTSASRARHLTFNSKRKYRTRKTSFNPEETLSMGQVFHIYNASEKTSSGCLWTNSKHKSICSVYTLNVQHEDIYKPFWVCVFWLGLVTWVQVWFTWRYDKDSNALAFEAL